MIVLRSTSDAKKMGKKGGWITAFKKAFTPKSKEKINTDPDNYVKEKKRVLGRKGHDEVHSFIPLYREPSSIEKILGEVEKEQKYKAHQLSYKKVQNPKSPITRQDTSINTSKNVVSNKAESSDKKTKVAPYKPKYIIPTKEAIIRNKKSITPNYVHISATKIQATYRGYMARKSYKALRSLLRLKIMMKGKSVRRQTLNTMKSMQLLVRIQTQIHARRFQMMENQNNHQNQISWRSSKQTVSSFSKWNNLNQLDQEAYDAWDDSMLTKEERDANAKRKVEAVMKRERALAYAYSHQLLTMTPMTAHAAFTNARSGMIPVPWNLPERQIPATPIPRPSSAANHRPSSRSKPPKTLFEGSTPRFSKPLNTSNSSNRWQATHARSAIRDDDSLTSCPAFTAPLAASGTSAAAVPNYMAPTVSAKAKVRVTAMDGGGAKEGKRFSFALSQSIGSLRLFSSMKKTAPKVAPAKEAAGRHRSMLSVGEISVDSIVSLPAGLGRRPFR